MNARVEGEVVERDLATRRVAGRGKAGEHITRVGMARSKAELAWWPAAYHRLLTLCCSVRR